MKVSLATIHCRATFIPLSLLYLKACLVERHGHARDQVDILEFPPGVDADTVVARLLATEPDVVGFSCYVWNVTTLMEAAKRLKARRPGVRIVLGGPEVGPVGESVLARYPDVDVVVASEGEGPFPEILAKWQHGESLDQVPGLFFRSNSAIVRTGEAPIQKELDELPSPHLGDYLEHSQQRVICIETQRGCVFRCNFCFYNKDLSIRNRRFDLDRVKQEILYWLGRNVEEIYLMDPVFNLNAARTKEICRFIAEHNTRRVPIHAEIWAEFVDEEAARLFRDANITFLEVGLQTTDDSALATVERRLKITKFTEGIGHLKAQGLPFELQLIYGLPGETRSTFRKSLNFAASLEPVYLAVFPLMVLPGTELWNKAEVLKIAFDDTPPYFVRSHMTMDTEDLAYGFRVSDAVKNLQTARSIQLLCREPGVTMADLVDDWIAWNETAGGSADDGTALALAGFVKHVCEKRGIPPDFYLAIAGLEFREAGG